MRLGLEHARGRSFDYYLLLNDDTACLLTLCKHW